MRDYDVNIGQTVRAALPDLADFWETWSLFYYFWLFSPTVKLKFIPHTSPPISMIETDMTRAGNQKWLRQKLSVN